MFSSALPDLGELVQGLVNTRMTAEESRTALQLLSRTLQQAHNSWPTLDLIRCHSKLSRSLREADTFGDSDDSLELVKKTADLIKHTYRSLADFIPTKSDPALYTTNSQRYLSHEYLGKFVSDFSLPVKAQPGRKPVVSIALPNGPLLAAVCIAVTSHYTAAPINPAAGAGQFQADVLQAGAGCILTTREDYFKLGLEGGWTNDKEITVLLVDLTDDMRIKITTPTGASAPSTTPAPPNVGDDIALILFTSGTSGKKKVVPITTHSIVAGVAFVIESWALTPEDVCLNMMPLYHVGGLIRNIFGPIFSGGATICCPAFDPNLFWGMVDTTLPTWYYASPSMHSLILEESVHRAGPLGKNRIRLVCNAAGGLLPSLAVQLRDTFHSVVLPSYGMTECMPISTPPVDYQLDRPGTSGISTGPDLGIFDGDFHPAPTGTVGRICVRGEPLFPGYLQPDGSIDRSALTEHGWFDTGDMGKMDEDGYLYITGRSKEVINRGGELISPFEVENAIVSAGLRPESPLFGRVSQALAFSVPHDVLQEVVGVVLVVPTDALRPDLRLLQSALKTSLQQAKWPTLVIYMDDLPKNNSKVLRIRLAERLHIPQLTDDTAYMARHWEAASPPADTNLSVPILSKPCSVNVNLIWHKIAGLMPDGGSFCIRMSPRDRAIRVILAPSGPDHPPLANSLPDHIKSHLRTLLHGYMVPAKLQAIQIPLPVDGTGQVDDEALQAHIAKLEAAEAAHDGSTAEGRVITAFMSVLSLSAADIASDANFFDLGGDSLKAGKLLAVLRSDFGIHVPIDVVFQHGSPLALAAYIKERLPEGGAPQAEEMFVAEGCEETRDSRRWWLMVLQLLPMVLFYPMRRAYQWTIFMVFLAYTQSWLTTLSVVGRLLNLSLAILFARFATNACVPWVGILAKWILIGRYKEGLYPMWGSYHTRWWLVQKIVDITGRGIFSSTDYTNALYLRMMGAKIGQNVKMRGCSMGEWDLVEIEDNAILERCTLRPFAGERNTTMYLGKIRVGRNATVGMSSIVAPGTLVPDGACIGANSSSWETDEADESNRDLLLSSVPGAHWALDWFVTKPLATIGWILSLVPWFLGLLGLVITEPVNTETPVYSILQWFAGSRRVGFHYLALVLRASLSPFLLFAFTLLMKWIMDSLFGAQQSGPAKGKSQVATWRMSFIKSLYSAKRLHEMTELMGQHYEGTSIAIRLLGGRVGRRVYWPGTGPSIGDYHLLDVGNDVVFGSRAHLVTSDGLGSDTIKVGDRAMIADRVTLLPGVRIGAQTTMGSGALTRRNKSYANGGTYVGSKNGDAVCLSTGASRGTGSSTSTSTSTTRKERMSTFSRWSEDDSEAGIEKHMSHTSVLEITANEEEETNKLRPEDASPFGRAFYLKQASFKVHGMPTIILYSSFITVLTAVYWNVPSISSIQFVALIFRTHHDVIGLARFYDPLVLYLLFLVFIAILTSLQAVLAIAAVIGAKWALLGRRQPGNYNWDESPYCQHWQLYLTIEKLRRYCYRGHGVLGMLTGTHWLVLYFRALGGTVGDNCALFANGRPSLMFTEPDLLTIGDRTVIDDASVVAHVNTRGKFDLNRLEIGARCVLRSGSRLLSGAQMRDDSALLEHTLIMGGDVVDKGVTMQGWPADRFRGRRVALAGQVVGGRPGVGTAASSVTDVSSGSEEEKKKKKEDKKTEV